MLRLFFPSGGASLFGLLYFILDIVGKEYKRLNPNPNHLYGIVPTVRRFTCCGPQLLSNLHGAVPDCRGISMWRSTATQQFTWRSSWLSEDLHYGYSAICMAQFPTVGKFMYGGPWLLGDLYGAVPDCRGILYGGPQLLSNLHGAVPCYQRIYTMATQQFVWRSSRLSGSLCMAGHGYCGI